MVKAKESEGLVGGDIWSGVPGCWKCPSGCWWVLHQNQLFTITPTEGTPLCMVVQAKQARCTATTLEEQTLEESETVEVPQSVNCPSPTKHHTGETPLGWENRKLHAFIWTFSGAFLLDQRWNVQCRGIRGVWQSTSVFWQWRYWSHWWGSKDMTNHDFFNPTLLHSRECKLTTWGCEMGVVVHAYFWGDHSVLNTDAGKLLALPMQGTLCSCYPTKQTEKICSTT